LVATGIAEGVARRRDAIVAYFSPVQRKLQAAT
jgi:hypothetical protein